MSMLSNAGSSAAAEDIMHFIRKLIEEMKLETGSEGYVVATKIYAYTKEIKDCADSGWY